MPKKIIVHLCDVDDGLMLRWNNERNNILNHNLIAAMKEKQAESQDNTLHLYYLFTNMDGSHIQLAHECTQGGKDKGMYVTRPRLITAMEAKGMPIQAVITWADRKYGQGLGKAYADKLAPMQAMLENKQHQQFSEAFQEFQRLIDFSDFDVEGMNPREREKGSTFDYTVANIKEHIRSQGIVLNDDDQISFIHYDDTPEMRTGVIKANRNLTSPYPVTTVATYQGKKAESKEYYLSAINAHLDHCPEFFSHANYLELNGNMPKWDRLRPQQSEEGPTESYAPAGRLYDFKLAMAEGGLHFTTPTHELSQAIAIMISHENTDQGLYQSCTCNGPHHALFVANFSYIVSREMLKNDSMKAKVDSLLGKLQPDAEQFLRADNYKNYHKLIEIMALLHDSGRPSDGIDRWDPSNCINVTTNVRYLLETTGLSKQAIDSIMTEVEQSIEKKDDKDLESDEGFLFGAALGAGDALHSGHAFHGGEWDERSFNPDYVRIYKQYPEFQTQFQQIANEVSLFVRLPTPANGGRLAAVKDYLAWHEADGDGAAILKHNFAKMIQSEFNQATHPIMAEHMQVKHETHQQYDDFYSQQACFDAINSLKAICANSKTVKTRINDTSMRLFGKEETNALWKTLILLSQQEDSTIENPREIFQQWQKAMQALDIAYDSNPIKKQLVKRLLAKLTENNPAYQDALAYIERCELSVLADNSTRSCTVSVSPERSVTGPSTTTWTRSPSTFFYSQTQEERTGPQQQVERGRLEFQ